jgi:DNA-binding GntR family transcriptional regulator
VNRSVDLGEADPRSYVRLAGRLRKQILSGDLVSGRPVPSITTLSQELGHARQTPAVRPCSSWRDRGC